MKKPVLLLLLLTGLTCMPCRAQSTGDLIQQLLLDFQKLQELKAILQDMYKGYEILDKGYTEIRNIAQGRFNLHKAFLDGLLAVSPAVRSYYRTGKIIEAEYRLVQEYRSASGRAHASGVFTGAELGYFDRVYSTLFDRSLQALEQLAMAITDGELRMSDAQRLRSIDRVYEAITGQLGTVRRLNNEVSVQMAQRERATNDIQTLKRLYDNP